MTRENILQVEHLKLYFNKGQKNEVRAVDDVSFSIREGETFGLVGESGSGKTTIGRSIIGLYRPTEGNILFEGKNIEQKRSKAEERVLRQKMQMIFQDPYASLNPRMKVQDIIAEGLDINHLTSGASQRRERVEELLSMVGLNPSHATRYPHEFSGGQRQRIGIARALAVQPRFIICDEPISALDVSIQAQVINLLKELQHNLKMTYLFIAHDLSMVKYVSERIGVMHLGRLVEIGSSSEIYHYGVHPYTESLLSAIPQPDPEYERERKRLTYRPEAETAGEIRRMYQIGEDHYVYCTEEEAPMYEKKLREKHAGFGETRICS